MRLFNWPSRATLNEPSNFTIQVDAANVLLIDYGDSTTYKELDTRTGASYPCNFTVSGTYPGEGAFNMTVVDSPAASFAGQAYVNKYIFASIKVVSRPTTLNMSDNLEISDILQKGYTISECMSNCSNNGLCKYQAGLAYRCDCFPDYIGDKCQVNRRPCSSVPCLNNGSCTEMITSNGDYNFTCDCLEYYSGSRCELFDLSGLCESLACEHGVCMIDKKTLQANCSCYPNYNGTRCENALPMVHVIKTVTKTSTIIAIVFISSFYILMLALDLANLFRPKRTVVQPNRKLLRVKYVNSNDKMHRRYIVRQFTAEEMNSLNI